MGVLEPVLRRWGGGTRRRRWSVLVVFTHLSLCSGAGCEGPRWDERTLGPPRKVRVSFVPNHTCKPSEKCMCPSVSSLLIRSHLGIRLNPKPLISGIFMYGPV